MHQFLDITDIITQQSMHIYEHSILFFCAAITALTRQISVSELVRIGPCMGLHSINALVQLAR